MFLILDFLANIRSFPLFLFQVLHLAKFSNTNLVHVFSQITDTDTPSFKTKKLLRLRATGSYLDLVTVERKYHRAAARASRLFMFKLEQIVTVRKSPPPSTYFFSKLELELEPLPIF
jgi:hypothetical protein